MSEVLFVVLGWVLGIFQPVLVDGLKKRSRLNELNTSILAELDELRYRLAYLSFKLSARLERADRNFFLWFHDTTKEYAGRYRDLNLSEALKKLGELTDEQLRQLIAPFQIPGRGIGFKHFRVPATDTFLNEISGFPEDYQRMVIDFRRLLEALNEEIDEAMNYHHKTFESGHTDFQQRAIQQNFEVACDSILKDSMWLIDTINMMDEYKGVDFRLPKWCRTVGNWFKGGRTSAKTNGSGPAGKIQEKESPTG